MSVHAISWALKQTAVESPVARHVLLVLANYAGEDGCNAFPSIARLSEETGLSERAVRNNLRELERVGVIRLGNQAVAAAFIARADRRPTVYDLDLSRGAANAARLETGGISEQDGGHLTTERGAPDAPDPSSKPSIEPSKAGSDEIKEAVNEYQLIAEQIGLSKIVKLSEGRRKHLKARLAEHGIETWRAAMRRVPASAFLCGKNDRRWRPDFDWFVNPTNFLKLIEGKYHDGKPVAASGELTLVQPSVPRDAERERWVARLKAWAESGYWTDDWGPTPDDPRCEAPRDLVDLHRKRVSA